jgi:hypothetical protein
LDRGWSVVNFLLLDDDRLLHTEPGNQSAAVTGINFDLSTINTDRTGFASTLDQLSTTD